jgi:hypothetical protein
LVWFGLIDDHKFLEFFFEQLVAGLKAVNQPKDAHEDFFPARRRSSPSAFISLSMVT